MSTWDTTIPIMVRHLINDVSTTPKYSDERIKEAVVVAGLIASQEYKFSTNYTFDLDGSTISPDPASDASYDAIAIALFGLKAACILSMNSYQNAVSTGIRVRDGDSEVDTTSGFKGYSDILKNGPCAAYEKLLRHRTFLASMNRGKAVLSPLTHSSFLLRGSAALINFFDDFRMER